MKIILLILLILLFLFLIFYRNDREDFACNITQPCSTIKCTDGQVKASLINNLEMCKCCDLDYINESEEKLKLYYNFDSTTLRSDSRIRNMSINTASDASNNSLITTPSYRYYKFENRGVRGPRATSVSIGAFKLLKDDKVVYNIGGWNDPKFGSLLIDLGNDKPPINQYTFNTFGINPQNDPVSWDFYGSNDNTAWSLLDSQKNINMPIQRNQQMPDFTIGYSLSYDATLSPGLNSNIANGVNGFIGPSCATFINENGFTDFMTIDTIKLDSNKFTFSFWISKSHIYTSQSQNSMYILQFQDVLKTTSISIYVKYNIINVQLDLPGGSAVFAINETLSYIDKWFHFVWTFDGKDWYVYINNKLYKELKQPSFLNNTLFSNNIIGGTFDKNINNRFIGKIDEFKFYNSYFSSELVSFLYEIGSNNVTPIPIPTISFNYPNTYINVNSSITSKINLNCEYGFSSSSSISGPIMLTFNPPPLNSILGFSEYIFERKGDVYGFKTVINTGIIVVIPIVPDVIYDENNNILPIIKPDSKSKNIENDQTIVLKIIINGSDIKYMCNDSVIYVTTRVSKLPVYVVGALNNIGQLFYNINITNKIPSDSSKKTNNLLYLALNKDPKLIYNLQFDPDEFRMLQPYATISKINISGVNHYLQLSQVIPIDPTGERIYYNSSKDKINCGDDKYNQPGWERDSNKYKPVDGTYGPRGHPNEYHNHPQSVGNAFWEWIFGDPIKISQIIIHSRSDCCTERLGNFNLNFYDNKNNLLCSTKLIGLLTNTFKYENSKLISLVSGSYSLIKNSLTNSTYNIKSFGPIFPVIEDGVNVLRLNDIKNNSDNSQDQHLELDPFDFTPDGTTICFWFKGTGSQQWSRIFDFGTDMCKNNLLMAINSTPGYLHFGTWCQGSDSNYLKFFQNYNKNWIHIAWVFSKSLNQYLLYLNGSLTYKLPGNYPVFTSRFYFYIGKSNWNWDRNLNGCLADFKIYQRELISSEVFALYSLHPLKKITDDYNKLEPTQLINYKYNLINDISNSLVKLDKKQLLYLDFDPKNINNNIVKNMIKNENNIITTAFGEYNLSNYNGLNYIETNAKNYSDSVIVPTINLSYNGLSFSFWIKPDAYNMNTRIFDFGMGEDLYNIICYINSSSVLTFKTNDELIVHELHVSGFNLTTWTHVVWTISINGIWRIYNNGSLSMSVIKGYPTVITRTSNFIGQSNSSNHSLINYIGLMDEFRMYYKELSIVEVSSLYSLKNLDTLNKDNSLVIYYDFETLNGDTLVNRGQNELILDTYNQNKGNVYKIIYNLPSKINTILKSNDYNYDSMFIKNNQVSLVNNSVYLDSTKEISLNLSPFQTNQDGITIAFWFKSDNSNDNSKIFDFGNGPLDDNIFFGIKNNLLYCSVLVAGVPSTYSSFHMVTVNDNTWRHVVWILQSNTWYFYINGELINTRNNTVYPNSILRKNIYFGKSNTSTDPYFNGNLGDFRLYNRILSTNELTSLYSLQIVDSLNTDPKLALSIGLLTKFTTINNNSALILNSYQNQYVAIDPIQITNNGISIAFWVIQKNSNDSSKIFDFDSIIGCEFNNSSLYFYINQDNAVNTFDPEISLPTDNTWSHITWTINNLGIHKFYFNGTLVKMIDSFYPISNTFTSNFIGKNSLSDSNNFSGILQEFYFTNNELTDVIVSSLHSKPTNVYSDDSILLYYNFDSTKVIKNNDKQPIPLLGYIPEYFDPMPQIKSNITNSINNFQLCDGKLKQVKLHNNIMCGVNSNDDIFYKIGLFSSGWVQVPGKLKHVSINNGKLYGVNSNDDIYYSSDFKSGNWIQIPGKLKQVDFDGDVICGVNSNDDIYYKIGLTSTNWVQIPGKLKYVSINNGKLYGVNSNDDIYYSSDFKSGNWVQIPGKLKQVDFEGDCVCGVNSNNDIYYKIGLTNANWVQIPGKLKHISFNYKNIAGINPNDDIMISVNNTNTTNKVLDVNSLTFENNDYINLRIDKLDLAGPNGYTFAFWFKSNRSSNWARIFDFGIGQGVDNIVFGIFNNSLACSIYKNRSPGDYTNFYIKDDKVVNINDNSWRHVTWVITPILTPINYQYYKFTPTAVKNQNAANSVQFSELIISYNGVRVDYSNASATNPGRSPGNETPSQGIDNSVNSKFLDFTKGPLIINFGKKTTINEYTFSTANDATERDPVSWIFYGSDDGNNWVTLDTQNNYPTPNERKKQLPFFSLNPSNNSQIIKAKFDFYVNSELIKTIDNAPYPNSIDRPYSYLGRSNWNGDPYLNGSIDDFRMYNRVLSTSEINSLFNLTYTDPLKNSDDKLIVSFPMYNPNNIIPYNFLKFDPTIKNYLNISSFNLVQSSLSFSFWFKTNSIITPLFEISDDDQTINVRISNNKLMVQHYIANKSDTYIQADQNNVNDNTWKHFVWIIDPNDNWIFYLNGKKTKSNINYQNIPSTFKKNQIGLINSLINPSNKSNYYYTGCISEFRILNRSLTDGEVNSLYINGDVSSLNDGQQIVYLPFDKNNIIVKSTPNVPLDGTLSNERAIVKENAKFGNSCVYLNKPIKDKQYLSINPFKIDGDSFTIAFWYKFEPINTQNTAIIDFSSDLNYFKIYITNNFTFNIDVKIDTDINKNSYSLGSYKNDWFHFLLIIKKSTMVAYVNNSPVVYFQKTKYPIINNDTNNYIGRSNMPKNIVSNISNINLGTNGIVPGNSSWNYYSVTWYGYFKPKDTGNYVFSTDSDDASYLWINEFNCNINNALVNNGRPHGMHRVSSRNIYLEANKYYYIRIVFGEQGGGDNMIVRFKGPDNGIDKYERSDGIGYYFNTETIITGPPDSDDSKYKPGLQFDIFSGYFDDDISFFPGITVPPTYNVLSIDSIGVGTNNLIQPNSNRHNYSVKWSGYFYAQETGVYKFSTDSDDASYLWLGDMVTNNTFTAANAIVNNGRDHGMVRINGQTPSLTIGTYYPILIVFGENGGGHNMIVTFTPPNKNETKNGSGYYFNDATQNIPGLKFRYYNQYFRENLNIFKNDLGDGKATWTNVTPMSFLTNISTDTLNGNIADFKIFNSELSSTDINLLYLSTKNKLVKGIADVESKTIDGLNNDSALLINFAFSTNNPFQNSVDNNIKLKTSNLNIASSDSYIGSYINLYNNNIPISPFRITNNSISISFWYKSIFCSGTNNIFNFNINGYGRYGYHIQNNLLCIYHEGINYPTNINYLCNNKWYLITIVYTNDLLSIYIDKKLEWTSEQILIQLGMTVGPYFGPGQVDSSIANFRYYNNRLSLDEISLLYDSINKKPVYNLKYFYRFENEIRNNLIRNNVTDKFDAFVNDPLMLTKRAKRQGVFGAIIDFGKNSFVTLPGFKFKKTGITISLWYRQLKYTENSSIFEFNNTNLNGLLIKFNLVTSSNKFIINMNLSGRVNKNFIMDSLFQIVNNSWYLLTITIDTNSISTLYINNFKQCSKNIGYYPDEIYPMNGTIGKGANNQYNYCKIDELRIYDGIINMDELNDLYTIKANKTFDKYMNDLNNDSLLLMFYSFKDVFINQSTGQFKNNVCGNTSVYNILTKKFDLLLIIPSFVGSDNPLYGNNYLSLNAGTSQNNLMSYPRLPTFTSDINGLSLSVWFKSRVLSTTKSIIRLLQLKSNDDEISLNIINNSINLTTKGKIGYNTNSKSINDNEWHHLVWNFYPEGLWAVYLDNIQIVYEKQCPYPAAITRTQNSIGTNTSQNIDEVFNGDIDEIRIYSRTLEDEEINALYSIDSYNTDKFTTSLGISGKFNTTNVLKTVPTYDNLITPKQLPNIIAWYDPSDIIVDPNTNELMNWNNQIANKLNFVSKQGFILPSLYASNLQVINFKTVASYIRTADMSAVNGFICVVQFNDNGQGGLDYLFSDKSSDFSFRRGRKITSDDINQDDNIYGAGSIVTINGTYVYNGKLLSGYDNTDKYIILYVKFGNNTKYKYDYDYTNFTFQLSSDFYNRGFLGNLGDFICFNKNHTTFDQELMEGYLAWKYNLQSNLPKDHPYSANPPTNLNVPSYNITEPFKSIKNKNKLIENFQSSPSNYTNITPLNINNVVAWYDPNSLKLNNDSTVNTWINEITTNSSLDLKQSGNITQAKFSNNLNMVSFNNTTSYLSSTGNTLIGGFICVAYLTNTNQNNDILFVASNNKVFSTARKNDSPNNDLYFGSTGSLIINGSIVFDNASIRSGYDNTNNYVILYVKFSQSLTTTIKLSNNSGGINGYIGDFICFNEKHTYSDRYKAEGYLAWKYGLERNLPITHKYSIVPPFISANIPVPSENNDGLSYIKPNISGTKIKQNFPNAKTGYYWIQTSTMDEPDKVWIDMDYDEGGWMLVYQVTNPTRNSVNSINYAINKSDTIGINKIKPQRIAYRLQNGDKPTQIAWASFDAWQGITNYDVPTGGSASNVFTTHRDVKNLNVWTNVSNIFNKHTDPLKVNIGKDQFSVMSALKGRLEIWPSNYGTGRNPSLNGGNDGIYDSNDSGYNTSIGYGSFQVHDMTKNQTILAWNRHGDLKPDIGFGNNPNGNPDWTFTQTTPVNFDLKIYIKIDIPIPPQPSETNDGTLAIKANISSLKLKQLPNLKNGFYYIQGPLTETPVLTNVDFTTPKDLVDPLSIKSLLAWYDPNIIQHDNNYNVINWQNQVITKNISPIPIQNSQNQLVTKVRIVCNNNNWLQLAQVVVYDQNDNIIKNNGINATNPGWGTNNTIPVDGNNKARSHPYEYHSGSSSCPFWEITINPTNIKNVVIYNRTDCCWDRLASFKLVLYNSSSIELTSVNLNTQMVQKYAYVNSKLFLVDYNLNLYTSGSILVQPLKKNYQLVNFTTNDSFLTSGTSSDLINAFICLVQLNNNGIGGFDMLFAPLLQNYDYSFRRGRIGNNIDGNDIHNGRDGLVYINGVKVYDKNNNININNSPSIWTNTDNYAIVYVKFGVGVHGYSTNTKLQVQISSFFMNRGIIGNLGDFFCLSPSHTDKDRLRLEGYIAWKWELQNLLPKDHIYTLNMPSIPIPPNISNNGKSSSSANTSASNLIKLNPNIASGNFWIQTPDMSESDQIFVDLQTDGGGWALVYETTSYKRKNNMIPYTVNKTNSIGLSKPSRIAYKVENNGKSVWVSFDAWNNISSYGIPTGDSPNNLFQIQRDVTNMNIIDSKLGNLATGHKGRLQIWPGNYGTAKNPLLDGGNGDKYDCNNTPADYQPNHACFQIHNINDINNPTTIFGWNHHRDDGSTSAFEFGFGNNTGNNNPDWTFSNTTPNNFKLQIYIKTDQLNIQVPNTDLWLSASKNVTLDNNNYITNIKDINNDAIIASGGSGTNPSLCNQYIDFTANNNKSILVLNSPKISVSEVTIYIALNVKNLPNKLTQIFSTGGSWITGSIHILMNGSKLQISLNCGNNDWITPYTLTINTDYIIGIVYTNNSSGCQATVRINGSLISTNKFSNSQIPLLVNNWEIGNWTGDMNRGLQGRIGEIMVFNRVLLSNETLQVENYLTNKFLPSFIGSQNNIFCLTGLPINNFNLYISSIGGLYSRYQAKDYNSSTNIWVDSSPNSRNLPTSQIINTNLSIISSNGQNSALNNFPVIRGTSATKIYFTTSDIASYTLIYICRYAGSNQNRIINGNSGNWLSGFWMGNTGCAYHEGWITRQAKTHSSNWFISVDSGSLYRSNGVTRSSPGGRPSLPKFGINGDGGSYAGERSDFDIAELLIFDRQLSLEEYSNIEKYLSLIYGITI
jgi:hypothetical protein